MERIDLSKPLAVPTNMQPSPTKRVRFSNGKVVQMNRKERRRNHLYGDRIMKPGR